MGQSPNGACYTDNPNDAVLVQGNADLKDGWVFPRVWTTEITKTAKAGDLIMSVRAPVGAMGKTAYDVVLGRGVAGIAGNEFLFQALSKKEAEGYWSTVSAGSTFDSINGDELRNTPVDYPRSKPEREAVGSCLSRIDCLITLHQRKCEYRSLCGYLSWEQRKLSSIAASFDYGLNAAATEYDGKNKYLRITDIDDATHEFLKSDLTTPLADLAMSADYLLEEGDLLFARTGASVGKTYLYRQYDGTVYFAGFLIRARIEESADPEFVYQATLTDAYKKFVAITSQRSGQPGVNAQEYADYQLMLPSRTEQQQIGMTLRSLDNLITLHQ